MKIYVLDIDPNKCAEYHCDKHILMRILETTEILFSAHEDEAMRNHPSQKKQFGMNRAMLLKEFKHPHYLWVRESIQNYRWLNELGLSLCQEYTYRWGKIHDYEHCLKWLSVNEPKLPDIGLTNFRILLPGKYNTGDPIESYRKYYIKEKQKIAKWKNGKVPYWFQDIENGSG